jgi:uncharacterized protein YqgC (DUF456 family)
MEHTLLVILTFAVMLVGMAGVFLPVLPGIELVWIAALGYGILHGFDSAGTLSFAVITLVFLVGFSSDLWITGLGARATGTSLLSVLAGGCLLAVGSLLFTPVVGIILWLSAILLIEYSRNRDLKKALTSTGSIAAGCTLTYGVKFVMGMLMMLVWAFWAFRG